MRVQVDRHRYDVEVVHDARTGTDELVRVVDVSTGRTLRVSDMPQYAITHIWAAVGEAEDAGEDFCGHAY